MYAYTVYYYITFTIVESAFEPYEHNYTFGFKTKQRYSKINKINVLQYLLCLFFSPTPSPYILSEHLPLKEQ